MKTKVLKARLFVVLFVLSVLSAGCIIETRNRNEVWACQNNPDLLYYGLCVDTGARVEW